MVTPLGTTLSIDEQVVAQGDVTFIVRIVESLIMEFDKTKNEEFLSSGSKSPRAWQYSKVSSEIRSQVFSETSPGVAGTKSVMAGCTHVRSASTSPMRPVRPTSSKANLATPFLFLSLRLPGDPNNL